MSSLSPDYNNMSVAEVVLQRQNMLDRINTAVEELNQQFRQNPMQLETETINNLFTHLQEINKSLEAMKQDAMAPKSHRCCGREVTKVTKITIGLEFFACILLGAAEIADFVLTQDIDQQIASLEQTCFIKAPSKELAALKGLGIVKLIFVVISTGVLFPLISSIRQIDSDKDKLELFMKISDLKEQENEILAFLKSFQDFRNTVLSDLSTAEQRQQQSFTDCVHCLDQLPEKGFKNTIPSRDYWISLMLQLLPKDHPIKTQLLEMRDAALKHCQSPSTTENSQIKNDSSTESEEDARLSDSAFQGEQMATPLQSRHLDRNNEFPLFQISDKRFQAEHLMQWGHLERKLGIRLDRIKLDDIWLTRNASLSPSLHTMDSTESALPLSIDPSFDTTGEVEMSIV